MLDCFGYEKKCFKNVSFESERPFVNQNNHWNINASYNVQSGDNEVSEWISALQKHLDLFPFSALILISPRLALLITLFALCGSEIVQHGHPETDLPFTMSANSTRKRKEETMKHPFLKI